MRNTAAAASLRWLSPAALLPLLGPRLRPYAMGNCLSSTPREASGRSQQLAPAAEQLGVADRILYPAIQSPTGALQAAVSQARYSAMGGGDHTPLLVRSTPQHTFIALFEGLGQDKHTVAAFCRSKAFELFQESSVRHPDSPLDALKATAQRLDATIFATDKLSHATKVGSGAACVLLLLELGGQRVYCANVGAAQCLLSRIAGSFNAKQPEGFFLSSEHTTRNKEEVVRLQKRVPGEATPLGATAAVVGSDAGQAAAVTRALGFMKAKRQAGGSGVLVCEAYTADHTLSGPDQHLVIASTAFWQLVGPTDCALRAHFHEKFVLQELNRAAAAAAATAAAAGGVPEAPSPSLLHATNTAEHLVYWALEKATRKLDKLQQADKSSRSGSDGGGSSLPPSVTDLMALPFHRPPAPPALPEAVTADRGVAGTRVEQEWQHAGQQEGRRRLLIRSDVHGDLGVLVVTLRRQHHSLDGGMQELLFAAAARAGAAAAGLQQGEGYLERTAQRRWAQVRMLVDFHKAHRRVLLGRWWEAQDVLFRRSRIASSSASRIHLFASPSKLASAAAARGAVRCLGSSPSKILAPPPPARSSSSNGGGVTNAVRSADA